MKYQGSKTRFSADILSCITQHTPNIKTIIEPFCGGANFTTAAIEQGYTVYPSDTHYYLIQHWRAVAEGRFTPPSSFDETLYKKIRNNKNNYPPELVGYVGFALSYGGKWFGGWCRDGAGKRDYVAEAYRHAMAQNPKLRGVAFSQKTYTEIHPLAESLIYCDPPYENTTGYCEEFDHGAFWEWCGSQVVPVYVSSYTARPGWVPVWSKLTTSSLTADTGGKQAVERLFLQKRFVKTVNLGFFS